MSLTKLLKAPIKLFKKEVITFLIIRRYDLGIMDESLQYLSVKPSASIFVLRQKIWHLLYLPDYCEEIIILKSPEEVEIPLTEMRRGNEPHRPYYLEVWPRPRQDERGNKLNTIMSIRNHDRNSITPTDSIEEKKESLDQICNASQCSFTTLALPESKLRVPSEDFKKSNLTCKFSRSSIFKLNAKKSQDNFTNLLLKIQNDLSSLSNKLSVLETKITN